MERVYPTYNRRRNLISAPLRERVEDIKVVLKELKAYWPLTLRQVYYQLVSREVIKNELAEYKKLSSLLARARLEGLVNWNAIEDRVRSTLTSGGWDGLSWFIEQESESFLDGYRRNLLCSQDVVPEAWIEKDALSRICHGAALPYCVPVVVARGYSSISFMHQCKRRITGRWAEGKKTIILYFGDFDPSGYNMPEAMLETLHGDMGIDEAAVELHRCALTAAQALDEFKLPHSPEALKETDSRARKFIQEHGRHAVELDALDPPTLEGLVRGSIESVLNMDKFHAEKGIEQGERGDLEGLKEHIDGRIQLLLRVRGHHRCPEPSCPFRHSGRSYGWYEYSLFFQSFAEFKCVPAGTNDHRDDGGYSLRDPESGLSQSITQ